jgi:hypothetical protein
MDLAENSRASASGSHGRGTGRPFQPGQSGNPGGRPKLLAEVRDMARASTVEAIETIRRLMLDEKVAPATRLAAADALLDRGWGKAAAIQPSDLNRPAWRELPREVLDQIGRHRCSRGHTADSFLVEEREDGGLRVSCQCGAGSFEVIDDAIALSSNMTGPW